VSDANDRTGTAPKIDRGRVARDERDVRRHACRKRCSAATLDQDSNRVNRSAHAGFEVCSGAHLHRATANVDWRNSSD
jgi:hypothetical protein